MDDDALLAREFGIFAAYLGASGDLTRASVQYRRAHVALPRGATRLDLWLVSIARVGSVATSLADAYARLARPYGLLRRKIVLTLAVLESTPVVHTQFDTSAASSPAFAWLAVLALGIGWGVRTIAAAVLLGPVHLVATLSPDQPRRG